MVQCLRARNSSMLSSVRPAKDEEGEACWTQPAIVIGSREGNTLPCSPSTTFNRRQTEGSPLMCSMQPPWGRKEKLWRRKGKTSSSCLVVGFIANLLNNANWKGSLHPDSLHLNIIVLVCLSRSTIHPWMSHCSKKGECALIG